MYIFTIYIFKIYVDLNHIIDDTIIVRAIKDIKKGEEITTFYINEGLYIGESKKRLIEKHWNFTCNCLTC